jgi:hypothetical protein
VRSDWFRPLSTKDLIALRDRVEGSEKALYANGSEALTGLTNGLLK